MAAPWIKGTVSCSINARARCFLSPARRSADRVADALAGYRSRAHRWRRSRLPDFGGCRTSRDVWCFGWTQSWATDGSPGSAGGDSSVASVRRLGAQAGCPGHSDQRDADRECQPRNHVGRAGGRGRSCRRARDRGGRDRMLRRGGGSRSSAAVPSPPAVAAGARTPTRAVCSALSGRPGRYSPKPLGIDHQDRPPVDERELLPKELGVVLGLAPELGHRAEVRRRGDQGHAQLVAAVACRRQQCDQLALLLERYARVLGKEQGLQGENVAGRVAVRPRRRGEPARAPAPGWPPTRRHSAARGSARCAGWGA